MTENPVPVYNAECEEGHNTPRVRCYLCHRWCPRAETDLNPYGVASQMRGGAIQRVIRYVRMCRVGYGCKQEPRHLLRALGGGDG